MSDAEILEEALERLRYGARRGQWATELTAEMCRVVVEAVERWRDELELWRNDEWSREITVK